MQTFKKSNEEVLVLEQTICNKCKKLVYDKTSNISKPHIEFNLRWEFPSTFDNEKHNFHLCESCYKEVISSFLIPIDIQNRMK